MFQYKPSKYAVVQLVFHFEIDLRYVCFSFKVYIHEQIWYNVYQCKECKSCMR